MTAVVLHNGALAEYEVEVGRGAVCTARLSRYKGSPDRMPPQSIELRKEGRTWVSNAPDRNLSDELGYAVEMKAKPILEMRRREGGEPAA